MECKPDLLHIANKTKAVLTGFPCYAEEKILSNFNDITNKLYQFRAFNLFSIVHLVVHYIALYRYSTLLPNTSFHVYHSKTI